VAKRNVKTRVKARAPKKVKAPKPRNRKPNTKGLVPFTKGQRSTGRAKGTPNKFTTILKDAILEAAERCGRDGKGKDGAVGYLMWLARREPAVYGRMLEKVMPMQIEVKDKTDRTYTPQEAIDRLRERGLPVPPSLTTLASQVGRAVQNLQDEDYEAELDGIEPEGEEEGDVDDDIDEEDDGETGGGSDSGASGVLAPA
jgi:hypothetical protein